MQDSKLHKLSLGTMIWLPFVQHCTGMERGLKNNDRTATGMRTREQWRVSELRYRRKTAMQQPLLQPPLIDDHPEVIKYLREAVEREFEVIATVGDGNALVAAAETLAPDVIVTDIVMPGLNGIAAAAEILRRNSAARIVFVTVHNEPELVQKGLATGALGYVLKLTAGEDLVPAIHAALRGEHHLSPTVGASDRSK